MEGPDMSTLTIAGLPVLAILEDHDANIKGNARRRDQDVEGPSDRQPPEETLPGGNSNEERRMGAQGTRKRPIRLVSLTLLPSVALVTSAMLFTPVPAGAANPPCNAVIAGSVTLTDHMDCTASATNGLRLSANT